MSIPQTVIESLFISYFNLIWEGPHVFLCVRYQYYLFLLLGVQCFFLFVLRGFCGVFCFFPILPNELVMSLKYMGNVTDSYAADHLLLPTAFLPVSPSFPSSPPPLFFLSSLLPSHFLASPSLLLPPPLFLPSFLTVMPHCNSCFCDSINN